MYYLKIILIILKVKKNTEKSFNKGAITPQMSE